MPTTTNRIKGLGRRRASCHQPGGPQAAAGSSKQASAGRQQALGSKTGRQASRQLHQRREEERERERESERERKRERERDRRERERQRQREKERERKRGTAKRERKGE